MARAPLPPSISITTFFVLQWVPEVDEFVVHLDDEKRSSHRMGGYAPQVARQLTWWGLPKMLAERVVDAAHEFRAVQAIPKQNRIINLIPRTKSQDVVADALRQVESENKTSFAHL